MLVDTCMSETNQTDNFFLKKQDSKFTDWKWYKKNQIEVFNKVSVFDNVCKCYCYRGLVILFIHKQIN